MYDGILAIWLNIMTIAIITFAVANIVISVVITIVDKRLYHVEVDSRQTVLWCSVLSPWLVSLLISCYFINEHLSLFQYAGNHDLAHWHHMDTFQVFSWHSITLLLAALLLTLIISKKVVLLIHHNRELTMLHGFAKEIKKHVFELNVSQASAFTSGFFTKRCYITSGMLKQTSSEEQKVIFEHEMAHAKRNDPFKKWLFSLLASFFITPLAIKLERQMTITMEQNADNSVLRDGTPATFIASTLVKVAKLNASGSSLLNRTLVANFGSELLEQRVYSLLGHIRLKPINKILTAFVFIAIGFSCLSSIDGIHHLIETLFSH